MWVSIDGDCSKLEGLKQMKFGVLYLCEFYKLVGVVCDMVDGMYFGMKVRMKVRVRVSCV